MRASPHTSSRLPQHVLLGRKWPASAAGSRRKRRRERKNMQGNLHHFQREQGEAGTGLLSSVGLQSAVMCTKATAEPYIWPAERAPCASSSGFCIVFPRFCPGSIKPADCFAPARRECFRDHVLLLSLFPASPGMIKGWKAIPSDPDVGCAHWIARFPSHTPSPHSRASGILDRPTPSVGGCPSRMVTVILLCCNARAISMVHCGQKRPRGKHKTGPQQGTCCCL